MALDVSKPIKKKGQLNGDEILHFAHASNRRHDEISSGAAYEEKESNLVPPTWTFQHRKIGNIKCNNNNNKNYISKFYQHCIKAIEKDITKKLHLVNLNNAKRKSCFGSDHGAVAKTYIRLSLLYPLTEQHISNIHKYFKKVLENMHYSGETASALTLCFKQKFQFENGTYTFGEVMENIE
ncbi:hypothetical protein RFI_05821 [Reticulomyxa filosa]|uniref:Uncharacterized protein n=1 Tax=Reticulomyxa filosa TaxID=46433 RepID=X6NZM8_RETFI|nr:hypothetical protein RFI_05821 [Reticulomyxa filosa]|eukprot:ETO31299.1 hypothetical protein RFI_05821 [Reticulomyxa filosa]